MYKKNLKITILLIGILVTIIASINIFVDPGKIYLKKIVAQQKANDYVDKLIKSKYGLFRNGWNERLVKTTLAQKASNYECVILGSSHIMQISNIRKIGNIQKQCKSLINLGVSGGSLEDIFVMSNILFKNNKLPKKIFIDIDPWTLKLNMDSRYGAYKNEYIAMVQSLKIKYQGEGSSYREKVLKNLINWEYFYSSIKILKEKKYKAFDYFNLRGYAPTKPYNYSEGSTGSIILPDGAHIYSNSYLKKQKKNNPNIPLGKGNYKIKGKIYEEKAILYLEKLIRFYQSQNVEVAFILTPYHPNVFKKGETKTVKHMKRIKNIILDIAKKYNLKIYGSFFPKDLNCKESEFLDFMHPTTDCLNKINFSH